MDVSETVTVLLRRHQQGDGHALDDLFPLVYSQLRGMASAMMRRERADHTLAPTALVHEAFLKLSGGTPVSAESRAHFLSLAARAMRQVLVDHARIKGAGKRGDGLAAVTLNDALAYSSEKAPALLKLDMALETLARLDKRKADVIEMKYFGGLSREEIAVVTGTSTATVTRDLRTAEAWLAREMS